jgi:hypothetical protein
MDSCSLRYFFLAAASFFLAIISLNLSRAAICLSDAPPFPLGGTGLPGWLPRGRTGLVVTGPRPPVEGAGLPGWLPRVPTGV